jgi:hypothetical protein
MMGDLQDLPNDPSQTRFLHQSRAARLGVAVYFTIATGVARLFFDGIWPRWAGRVCSPGGFGPGRRRL